MPSRSADDWVQRGLKVLQARGIEAVRVEAIARALKVTKGSFYWHFEDRRAWLKAMVAQWERVATAAVIELVEREGGGPRERLSTLLLYTSAHPGAPKLEQAMRAWGARDAVVAHALERVDAQRVTFVKGLLMQLGIPAATAQLRSRGLYLALIGEFASISHGGSPSGPAVWTELIRLAATP